MAEVKREPIKTEDAGGDPLYTFDANHSIMDVLRWLVSQNAGDTSDLILFLQEMKVNPDAV